MFDTAIQPFVGPQDGLSPISLAFDPDSTAICGPFQAEHLVLAPRSARIRMRRDVWWRISATGRVSPNLARPRQARAVGPEAPRATCLQGPVGAGMTWATRSDKPLDGRVLAAPVFHFIRARKRPDWYRMFSATYPLDLGQPSLT